MKWQRGRRSSNVEDRRGMRVGPGMRRGRAGGGIGLVGLIIVVVVALALGVDPVALLQGLPSGQGPEIVTQQGPASPEEEEWRDFVSVVLADTEDTWSGKFKRMNGFYQEPSLVLFTGAVNSACGFADAAVGPFYCPGDRKVYLDLGFFDELRQRFDAPGDFAQAYVIAHEIGHHVQTLLGIEEQVRDVQSQVGQSEANALSVMMELQADCLAGVWAHSAEQRQLLEVGDVEEALNAASAIGDDRIQQQTTGQVRPDSFTHGSSAQRVAWFKRGMAEGDLEQCDTFGAAQL
jgi:uncharacterized protein